MRLIYRPKGKAREYSPMALNVYSGGCDHGCGYCYCNGVAKGRWGLVGVPRDLKGLSGEAAKSGEQILMSFMADPYCKADVIHGKTREALLVLREAGCSVALLSKGGERCLRDLDLFVGWPEGRIKVGATLTFFDEARSKQEEPGAASPAERIETLTALRAAGVKTWASIEPVIDPAESLAVMSVSLEHADSYKIGKWNHDARSLNTDWAAFARDAVSLMRDAGKRFYIKEGLRAFLPEGFLTAEESCPDSLCLPRRPEGWTRA